MTDHAIENGTFADGFKVGFQAIQGTMTLVPLTPLEPLTPLGSTPFLTGVKYGVQYATGIEL